MKKAVSEGKWGGASFCQMLLVEWLPDEGVSCSLGDKGRKENYGSDILEQ